MLGILSSLLTAGGWFPVGQAGGVSQTPEALFQQIFTVFVVLGSLVGIVVIGYMLYNAYKYRAGTGRGAEADDSKKVTRPEPGQIPTGSGGGKKLFLSFGISAVIVLSLIVWTYSALLFVETTPEQQESDLTVEVVGEQFAWQFHYPNGETSVNEMVVPEGAMVELEVSTADVFHNFNIPKFRTGADAMPGHTLETWFVADERGNFTAECREICGAGHSGMNAQVRVVSQEEFEEWYGGSASGSNGGAGNGTASNASGANADLRTAATIGGVGA